MKKLRKIAITTGDVDGVGFEVTAKALVKIKNSNRKNNAVFFMFRHKNQSVKQARYFKLLQKKWNLLSFTSLGEALSFLKSSPPISDNTLIDLVSESNPADWVVEASAACKNKKLSSLVTAPLSKSNTSLLVNKPVGHTGIFRQLYPDLNLHMGFVGKDFNVLLATDHIAISDIQAKLLAGEFKSALLAGAALKSLLQDRRPIAVLGLNPHAGEKGIIGSAESQLFARKLPKGFVGPLVPDAAFFRSNWKKYSLFVCLYHDQGLIPFKMHHGQDSGVHITVGMPFVRTSVDHGTATDIFNKNKANPASMKEAIELNLKIAGV